MKRTTLIWMLVIILLGGALQGCSSSRNAYNRDDIYGGTMSSKKKKSKNKHHDNNNKKNNSSHIPDVGMTADARKVLEEAYAWLGTPYRLGGETRNGVDCSGLTCMAYKEATGIKLPRSSREQADFCHRVRRSELRPGDLVFFSSRRGGDRINHVAIYVGDNSIIHATSSQGVVVSNLDEDYWKSHFYSCGRVL